MAGDPQAPTPNYIAQVGATLSLNGGPCRELRQATCVTNTLAVTPP